MTTAGEHGQGPIERVIGDAVEPIAVQPCNRFRQGFTDQIGTGIDGFRLGAELFLESWRLDAVRSIESPAIDALAQPILGHLEQESPHSGGIVIELWQSQQIVPAGIAHLASPIVGMNWPLSDLEPVPPRRGRTIFDQVVEWKETAADMIEDAIQNDPHALAVCRGEQIVERRVAAQQRIDLEIIAGVITVIGRRLKDGIQIKCIDAKILQVIQAVARAAQCSPFITMMGR